jgi:hypothetical protein
MGISFSKIMPLITVLTRDSNVRAAVRAPLGQDYDVAGARSWDRLLWLVRERPVTVVVLDGSAFAGTPQPAEAVADLRRRFPSLSTVFVESPRLDPRALLHLGRVGVESLVLVQLDGLAAGVRDALSKAATRSTESLVARAIGGRLPTHESHVIRSALNGVQLGWSSDELADRAGFTRAHLSVRLKECGLPSAGHLLLWAKLLHAGRWLTDPARSAESIYRQLHKSGLYSKRTYSCLLYR